MSLGSLQFRPRRGVANAEDVTGGIRIPGEIEWVAWSSASEEVEALVAALGPMAERIGPTHAMLRLGNAVGQFQIGDLGRLEAYCGKWDETDFERMLADVSAIATGLPFASSQWQGLPHERLLSSQDPVLLHLFLYIRQMVLSRSPGATGLLPALETVLRDPHRRFVIERAQVAIGSAQRADNRTFERLACGADLMARAGPSATSTPLARRLGGKLPTSVDCPRAYHTVDTVENAFVKGFLDQIAAIVNRVAEIAFSAKGVTADDPSFWARISGDCRMISRALHPFRHHDIWEDVSPMTQVPVASSVLQRRRGYRDVLRHYLAMRAAVHLPLDNTHQRELLGVKDVASLYELWAFFQVISALSTLLGTPPSAVDAPLPSATQIDVPWGFRAAWTNGVAVYYNLTFTSGRHDHRRSTSVLLRPDIVVQVPRGGSLEVHVLDAKFRLNPQAWGEGVRAGTYKTDDIVKMHAYRDALPAVRSAFIIYPGDVAKVFAAEDGSDGLQGVGAVPATPRGSTASLVKHLRRVLG